MGLQNIQGEHKFCPWLQTFITRKLRGIQIYIFLPLLKLVSKILQQDGAPPHWGSHVRRFLDAKFPNWWIGRDGPTSCPPRSPDITPFWLLFIGVCYGQSVFDTSSRYYKFEGKINRRFCYNNWRYVGEHVERNWLSIRRSPCNKSSHVEVY